MIEHALSIVNSKGGVGKTSVTANLAATAAMSGWRTLAVDLDAQGNLACDLGYREHTDEGAGLLQALMAGQPLEPLHNVRDRLDVIAGGRHTRRLGDLFMVQALEVNGTDDDYRLSATLEPIAAGYDLVLIDCPPTTTPLVRATLGLARWALIPTKIDDASIDGLESLAHEMAEVVRTVNPILQVLGVVLFDVGAGDRRLRRQARDELQQALAGIAPVLDATIRHSRRAAWDMRRRGEVAMEYEQAALAATPWYAGGDGATYSSAAGGLAEDYQQLANEVLSAVAAAGDAPYEGQRQ